MLKNVYKALLASGGVGNKTAKVVTLNSDVFWFSSIFTRNWIFHSIVVISWQCFSSTTVISLLHFSSISWILSFNSFTSSTCLFSISEISLFLFKRVGVVVLLCQRILPGFSLPYIVWKASKEEDWPEFSINSWSFP